MKAIHGKVDISQKWKIVDQYYSGTETVDFQICENCGMRIKDVAVIENEDKSKRYHIGCDCAATLTSIGFMELEQAKKVIRNQKKFLKSLAKEVQCVLIDGDGVYMYKSVVSEWKNYWLWRMNKTRYEQIKNKIPESVVTVIVPEEIKA
jgi:hypothetical protein